MPENYRQFGVELERLLWRQLEFLQKQNVETIVVEYEGFNDGVEVYPPAFNPEPKQNIESQVRVIDTFIRCLLELSEPIDENSFGNFEIEIASAKIIQSHYRRIEFEPIVIVVNSWKLTPKKHLKRSSIQPDCQKCRKIT